MRFSVNKILVYLVEGLIFILPLFFIPGISKEFAKQLLLWIFPFLILGLFLFFNLKQRVFKWQKTLLDVPLLILLTSISISCILGTDIYSSFFGYWDNYTYSLFGFLGLVTLYFVIVNLFADINFLNLVYFFIYSYCLGIIGYFLSVLFFDKSFNVFGDSSYVLLVLSVFISVLSINLLINFSLSNVSFKKEKQAVIFIALFLSLFSLLFFNFKIAWFVLMISLLINIIFLPPSFCAYLEKKKILLILLSIFFLSLLNINWNFFVSAKENWQRLDYETSSIIIGNSLKQHLLFGNGFNSFAYVFSRYRPQDFNYFTDWQIRFSKSSSFFLDLLNDIGLVGVLFYFFILVIIFLISFVLIKRGTEFKLKTNFHIIILPALISSLFSLFLLQFFYPFDTVILFIFWVSIALIVACWLFFPSLQNISLTRQINYYLKNTLSFKVIIIFVFIIYSSLFCLFVYEIKIFSAEFIFQKGRNEENLSRAAYLAPKQYYYQLALAKFYAKQVQSHLAEPSYWQIAQKSLKHLHIALNLAPNSVISWETAGMIYYSFWPFLENGQHLAINSLKRAIELEPSNPVLLSELGKIYLASNNLSEAKKYLQQAIDKKTNYYDAYLNLAKAYIAENNYSQALKILFYLKDISPSSDVYYELGRVYYNKQEFTKAESSFQKSLNLNTKNINAWYSLGLTQKRRNKNKEALISFKKALKIDPDNLIIKNEIANLEALSKN